MKRLLFFCVNPPAVVRSGLDRRCLEMLAGYQSLGCETLLLGLNSTRNLETPLRVDHVSEVAIYSYPLFDRAFLRGFRSFHRLSRHPLPVNSVQNTPPGFRWWFRQQFQRWEPDIVVIVYAMWDGLLDAIPRQTVRTVMETIDLTTLNQQMWHLIEAQMPPVLPVISEAALREDFYIRENLSAKADELRVYNRYDFTIAISSQEAAVIKAGAPRTRVLHIPMTMPAVECENTYDGPAVFPMGPNPFNWHGYYYFALRVLPRLLRSAPDFKLVVTGSCEHIHGEVPPEIEMAGFVPDLAAVYRRALFLACPVYGGTGQLVKVVEAMAHGVPAIALEAARHRVPIQHGEDGLIAANAEEFAECAARLWNDRKLCRRLGEAARERTRREFSREKLVEALRPVVDS